MSKEDTAADIAADVASRIVNKDMSARDAFRDVGYAELWSSTREAEMPDGWENLSVSKMADVLEKVITKAMKRTGSMDKVAFRTKTRKLTDAEVEMVKESWSDRKRGQYRQGQWQTGMKVIWKNQRWFVYELNAEQSAPDGVLLTLVSPDLTEMVDWVPTDEVNVSGTATRRATMNKTAVAEELVKIAQLLSGGELSVPEQHQKKIAISTLKMSDMGARIMGGMSKDEARAFLKKIGYSDSQIAKIENG